MCDELAVEASHVVGPERLHREHVLADDVAAVLHGDAVVLDLVLVPAEADAEHEPAARELVERGDRLGGDDRLALGGQAMPVPSRMRSVTAPAAASATNGSSVRLYSSAQLGVAGRRRRAPLDRDVRVLGEVQRVEAALLGLAGQLDDVHRPVGREHVTP